MSQQSATNMSRPTSSSPASAVAATSESAASKKHKIDEIVNESPKETSSDEMTDATAPETPVDFPDHPDAPAPKKLKVSELSPPMNDIREHEEDKANALQVLRKKQRDEKLAKKGKGILEYVKSSKKARLNPHRPRGQEEVQDEEMVDQEEMHVQHVLLQQANDAQEDPVTGGVDTEMHNAQPAGGPTSLEALVASHGDGTNGQAAGGQDAAQNAAGLSSSNAAVVAASNGATTVQPAPTASQYFNAEIPGLHAPWLQDFPQPHARFSQDTPCPISWPMVSGLGDPDRDAYELRAPWNPKPMSWEGAVKAYVQKHGQNANIKSPEGLRKRFKRANLAIFKATGVYFYMSSLGLEEFDIPVDAKLAAMEKAANDKTVDDASEHVSDDDQSGAKKTKTVLPCHVRERAPHLTIHTLLANQRFAESIDESDMILDKIYRVLENDKALSDKYGGNGAVCEGDIHEVARLLDLEPKHINRTSYSGSCGKLLLDVFLHGVDAKEAKQLRRRALRSDHHARELYKDFACNRRQTAIASFVETITPDAFCEMYHSHHKRGKSCYRERAHKDLKPARDIYKSLHVNGIGGYIIENKTRSPLDMQTTISEEPSWDWERVKAVSYYVQFPLRGPQKRVRAPQYYHHEERDSKDRYPSHPEYEIFESGPVSAWDVWAEETFGDVLPKEYIAEERRRYYAPREYKTWEEEGWEKPFGAL